MSGGGRRVGERASTFSLETARYQDMFCLETEPPCNPKGNFIAGHVWPAVSERCSSASFTRTLCALPLRAIVR